MTPEPLHDLLDRLDAAARARERLRARPLRDTIAALAAAAGRWRNDAELAAALPDVSRLSAPMIAAGMTFAADAIDAGDMTALVEREWGPGAASRPAPHGPTLVAHVVASNVPALAVPAIALGCLAGAAVLIKSGRHDPLSAPAFRRALDAADPELAATVVPTYWAGGDAAREDAILGCADVVVATGGDETLAALRRFRLVAHGPRVSVAAIGPSAATDEVASALALDVVMHDQRGCLSPHAVFVAGDAANFARRLAAALDVLAGELPGGPAAVAERAAVRVVAAEAEWSPRVQVLAGRGGTVIVEPAGTLRPTGGLRTVRVHPLSDGDDPAAYLPPGAVECVGFAGLDPAPLAAALRARGVSRLCPIGRMQRPRLTWPRGQQPPLGVLRGRRGEAEIEVES